MDTGKTKRPMTFSPREGLEEELDKNPKCGNRNTVLHEVNTLSERIEVKKALNRTRRALILDVSWPTTPLGSQLFCLVSPDSTWPLKQDSMRGHHDFHRFRRVHNGFMGRQHLTIRAINLGGPIKNNWSPRSGS